MAIGLTQRGIGPEENRVEKEKTYDAVRRFMREFAELNGSTVCRDLLGCDISTPEGYARAREEKLFARCPGLVRDTVGLVAGITESAR